MKYSYRSVRDNRFFQHGIQVHGMLNFHSVRNWMTATYGFASAIANDVIDNAHWSFHMEYQVYMIYLRSDEELSWFRIKYGDTI